MADNVEPGPAEDTPQEGSEQLRPVVTRREFIAGAGAGVAVGAVVAGGIAVAFADRHCFPEPSGGPLIRGPAGGMLLAQFRKI